MQVSPRTMSFRAKREIGQEPIVNVSRYGNGRRFTLSRSLTTARTPVRDDKRGRCADHIVISWKYRHSARSCQFCHLGVKAKPSHRDDRGLCRPYCLLISIAQEQYCLLCHFEESDGRRLSDSKKSARGRMIDGSRYGIVRRLPLSRSLTTARTPVRDDKGGHCADHIYRNQATTPVSFRDGSVCAAARNRTEVDCLWFQIWKREEIYPLPIPHDGADACSG